MKVCGLAVVLILASLLPVWGQVTVEVTQEQQQFLQGESMPVGVRITNRSGQTLHLGGDDDWLSFSIESGEGRGVPKLADVPVKGEFELESSRVAIKRADLVKYFAPMTPGHYSINATIHVKDWNREVASAPRFFDVIEGARLWEQEVGVPVAPGSTNEAPELRRFILQQANYLRGQIRLYLRVTDSYGKTYRVFPIGKMLSFSRPEPQVDKFSHLHVLYQNGPTTFSYTSYDLDGMMLARQTYEYVGAKPRLRMNEDGVISVAGGQRRLTESDIPPVEVADGLTPVLTNEVAPASNPPSSKALPPSPGLQRTGRRAGR
jgi:hypothetical protein